MNAVSFRYRARTAAGEIIRGRMDAPDADSVGSALRARALFVTSIAPESGATAALGGSLRIGTPPRRALVAFFRGFATLVRAGVPMRRALDVTIESAVDTSLRETLRAVLSDIEQGIALSDAFARRPRAFSLLCVAMVRAGETGGILDDVLERLATLVERDADLRKKLRSALAYPAVVLGSAAAVLLFLIARIMPMFAQMFDAFHVELPVTTRALLACGAIMQNPTSWFEIAAVALALLAAFVFALRSERGALACDDIRLRLPLIGPLSHKAITARLARLLGTLLAAGIELTTAITVVAPVTGSRRYAVTLERVNVALRAGDSLTIPLQASGVFDPLALALVSVGEETGLLDRMLLTIAAHFENDVEAAIATLGAVLEPVLIGGLGVVVGFIVFSVFAPLYTLIGSVSQ